MVYSHLLTHLLEVIEQLQGGAQALGNETAALTSTAHEPEGHRQSAPPPLPSHPTPRLVMGTVPEIYWVTKQGWVGRKR